MRWLALCWPIPLTTLACSGAADVPGVPNLESLIARYEQPDAALDISELPAALRALPPLDEIAAGFAAAETSLGEVKEDTAPAAQQSGFGVRLQGSINITVRCPGDLGQAVLDPAVNGSLVFTLAVAESRIHRTAGGRANACVLRGTLGDQTARVVLDGDFAIDMGGDIGFRQPWPGPLLFVIGGQIEIAGHSFNNISGRFKDGKLEHLFSRADGKTFVATLGASGFTIRDRDGIWLCADVDTCARP
jgi:hypothetical protein